MRRRRPGTAGGHAAHPGLAALRAVSAAAVSFDLARIAAERRPPPLAQGLVADRRQALDRLAGAVTAYHATVLRKSGLISTQRHRNTVLHTLTPLGAALIDANPLSTQA